MSAIKGWKSVVKGISAKLAGSVYEVKEVYASLTAIGADKAAIDTAPKTSSVAVPVSVEALPVIPSGILNKPNMETTKAIPTKIPNVLFEISSILC